MTPTAPTPLAEQIAREHAPHIEWEAAGLGIAWRGCSCGERISRTDHRAHIATVTERAVRERATRAVARMNITGPMRAIFTDPVHREALDALEVLVAQEIETALHAIANGDTDA